MDNIGVGNFTNVVKGKWKQNGKEYAIKVINKQKLNQVKKHDDIMMEKYALGKLKEIEEVVDIYSTF